MSFVYLYLFTIHMYTYRCLVAVQLRPCFCEAVHDAKQPETGVKVKGDL